ncbi:MAG: response regulator [Deltaproteobacteria bacterium]|nr:response regulator [Deltaproteobacteria bacterium]
MSGAAEILVVDDSPTVQRFLELALAEAGYRVTGATCGRVARQHLARQRFDLLLADKNLEDDDGFSLCHEARRLWPEIACVLITADTSVDSAARAVEESIDAYLLKPLRKQNVLSKVENTLERIELIRQREQARAALQLANDALELRTQTLEQTIEKLRQVQHRLVESEKQVAIGMLAAGVAHEINNPMCFILPNLEYLDRTLGKLAQAARQGGAADELVDQQLAAGQRMLAHCHEGIERITHVVQTLRLFSHRTAHGALSDVDVAALCRTLIDLISHELAGHAALEVNLGPVEPVRAREADLAQIVLDVVINARRSVLSKRDCPAPQIALSTEMIDGRVAIVIEDNGELLVDGQTSDDGLDAIFGDGFSGPSLHLGLARDLAQRCGGRLDWKNRSGVNRLEISLPPTATDPRTP